MIIEKIEREIERERYNKSHTGTEITSVSLMLTEAEIKEFDEQANNLTKDYWWEKENNILYVNYSERRK